MSRKISLTQGKYAIVDDADFDWLNKSKWFACKGGATYYAYRCVKRNGLKTTEPMHRVILGLSHDDPRHTDHINFNGLDNRRSNIRPCTPRQNMQHARFFIGASRFKGVTWHKHNQRWRVQIHVGSKRIELGCYISEYDAAKAYDAAARTYFEKFACLNLLAERCFTETGGPEK